MEQISILIEPPVRERLPAARAIVDFVHSAEVTNEVLAKTASTIVDSLAVTFAGARDSSVQTFAKSFERLSGDNTAPLLWEDASYSRGDAALIWGMASHVLDYDDVSMLVPCHPTVPVLAAALCSRKWETMTGRELCAALAVGAETSIRLGQVLKFRHYNLGFHATATIGAIGAAAACARLLKLSETQTRHALAIAASQAAGLKKNFGSMVKSIHVGLAASNGLRSAVWAAAGVEADEEPFEKDGFLYAFSGGETDIWDWDIKLGAPFAIEEPGFEQKRYPCCYMLHKMIEGTLRLIAQHGIKFEDVESVRVEVPPGGTKALIHPFPRTGMEAKFSGPYVVMAGLADRCINLASFTDANVLRPAVVSRLRKVEVVERTGESRGGDVGSGPATVSVRLVTGQEAQVTITEMPGSPKDPISKDQLFAKWNDGVGVRQGVEAQLESKEAFERGLRLFGEPVLRDWLLCVKSLRQSSAS